MTTRSPRAMKFLKNDENLTLFGQIIIALFFSILTLTSIGWLVYIPMTGFHLPVAFACSLLIVWAINNRNDKVWRVGLWTVCIIAISIVVSGLIFDCSFDGQVYHQSSVAAMAHGWNPIHDHHNNVIALPPICSLIIDHYLRGTETLQAAFYSSIKWIESAKAVNILFLLAGFSLILPALRSRFSEVLSNGKILLISTLLTMCTVTVTQVLTFYIDHVMYSLMLCSMAIIIDKRNETKYYKKSLLIAMLTAISITVKLNTFFFFGLLILIYLGWTLYFKERKLSQLTFMLNGAVAIVGVFVLAFNPIVTNTIDHQHPFYPLMVSSQSDEQPWDIMTGNTPVDLREGNRVKNVLLSNFSLINNLVEQPVRQGIPSRGGEALLFSPDTRVGGFGLFFGISVVLSSILYLSSRIESKTYRRAFATIILATIASVFIFAEGWWARYVPFFWALPITMMLYWELSINKRAWQKLLSKLIYTLMAFNALSGFAEWTTSIKFTARNIDIFKQSAQYAPFQLWVGPNVSIPEKLDLLNIEHTTLQSMPDTSHKSIHYVGDDLDGFGSFFVPNTK